MAQANHGLSSLDANGNDSQPPKPKSFDFCGQHELDFEKIEMELHSISARAMAVEMVGRNAQESVHGEELGEVFDFLASDIHGDVARLKELLGLDKAVRP